MGEELKEKLFYQKENGWNNMDEIKMFIGINKKEQEIRLLEGQSSKIIKYKNKEDLENILTKFVKENIEKMEDLNNE